MVSVDCYCCAICGRRFILFSVSSLLCPFGSAKLGNGSDNRRLIIGFGILLVLFAFVMIGLQIYSLHLRRNVFSVNDENHHSVGSLDLHPNIPDALGFENENTIFSRVSPGKRTFLGLTVCTTISRRFSK